MPKTNDLKKIGQVLPIASGKPGSVLVRVKGKTHIHSFVLKTDDRKLEETKTTNMIIHRYRDVLTSRRQRVDETMTKIYGFPIPIKDAYISETILKMQELTEKYTDPLGMCDKIKGYLGFDCPFHRIVKGRKRHIRIAAIETAYNMCIRGESPLAVKYALYIE